ncbi:hypothetical protein BGX28_009878 [Mortierella sp. GBA30]|nr:hypothetical protein BGX28_009878 [Mortierella sp. GBA30]
MASTLNVLIANEPGKSVSVPYKHDEPIFFIVQRVSQQLNEVEKRIVSRDLYMGGIRLHDQQRSIADYRIFGSVVTYHAVDKGAPFNIYIRMVQDEQHQLLTLTVNRFHTVDKIMQVISDRIGIPYGEQRLLFAGKRIFGLKTLQDYGIQRESMLHLLRELRGGGGGGGGIEFSDVSDTSNIRKIGISKTKAGPPGLLIAPGTNVECKCECTPDYRVICRQRFGTIEVSQAEFECPNCKSNKVVPVTVGFMECKYRFHGIKLTGEQYTSEWKSVTEEDLYQRFDPSKQTTWRRLIVESAPLSKLEDCVICLEPMEHQESLSCGHRFHEECYSKWKSCCPNCRFNQHLISGWASETA